MPVQTITCPECNGKGFVTLYVPTTSKKGEILLKKKQRLSCPRCGGLGVIQTEIPDFIPENLKKFVNV